MRVDAVPKIEVIGLSKRFGPAHAPLVLDNVDLACAENEFVCLLGRSGCGKTSGRIKTRIHVLDYTYTEPLAALDPSLVKVPGRWKV